MSVQVKVPEVEVVVEARLVVPDVVVVTDV